MLRSFGSLWLESGKAIVTYRDAHESNLPESGSYDSMSLSTKGSFVFLSQFLESVHLDIRVPVASRKIVSIHIQ